MTITTKGILRMLTILRRFAKEGERALIDQVRATLVRKDTP